MEGFKPDYEKMSWIVFKEQFQNKNDCYEWLFSTRLAGWVCLPQMRWERVLANFDVRPI